MTYNANAVASGITLAGTYDSGIGETGSEVVAFENGRLYVTNGGLGRIDVIDAATMTLAGSLDLTGIPNFNAVNSVAVKNGVIAVAIDTTDIDNAGTPEPRDGTLALFEASDLTAAPVLVATGNHPDMVTFSADGTRVFVANEAEKDSAYVTQPRGGVTVVDISGASPVATTHDFSAFDGQEAALRAAGIRIFPGASFSRDAEPEYIAVSPDGTQLFVTLQEANAVAVFDIAAGAFTAVRSLGTTDHSQPGSELDASDRDDAINIQNWPVFGLRMADTIAAFEIGGQTYYATANEGDDRGEDERVGDLTLDPVAFPDAAALQDDAALGRLGVSTIDGDTDGDNDYDALYAYGSRSFSVFAADGTLVFDSGSLFERAVAALRVPNAFNNDGFPSDLPGVVDDGRSDNKGPEPEALTVGSFDGATYAFVGLERDGGIMVFRIDDAAAPELAAYIESSAEGDVSPETIRFIDAADSATGNAQIAVAYEISGTTALIDLAGPVNAQVQALDGDLTGSIGRDKLVGRAGSNDLSGGGATDLLRGRAGDDVLSGGFGDDFLRGGAGADRFVFGALDGRDRIGDFEEADTIDLSATGAAFVDLDIQARSATRTVVLLGDDLKIVLRHLDDVTVDASDFLF